MTTTTPPQSPAPQAEVAEPVAWTNRAATSVVLAATKNAMGKGWVTDLTIPLYAAPLPSQRQEAAQVEASEARTRAMNAALTYRNHDPEAMDDQDAWAELVHALGALATPPAASRVAVPLTLPELNGLARQAQIDFCLDKASSFELAFAAAIQRACAEAWGVTLTEQKDGEL